MSEVDVLSKILNPAACQQDRKTNAKKNVFDSKPVNQPYEKDAERTIAPQPEAQETGSASKQDTSNKEFGRIYENAIKQPNKEQESQTDSSSENSEQPGVDEQKPPVETASAVPVVVLETPAPEKVSEIEQIPLKAKSAQQGTSVQQQKTVKTPAAPAEPQTSSIQNQTADEQVQNTPVQMTQKTKEPTNQPQTTELLIQAQNKTATPMTQQQSAIQNTLQQTDAPAKQSDNSMAQPSVKPIETGPPEKIPVPEHVEIANETARDRLAQPLPRGSNTAKTPSNAASQTTASPDSDSPKIQIMNETEDFQFSGEQKFSHANPGTEIADSHQPADPPGQEILNTVSAEHAAQPSENASVQATQTPSRLGTVTEPDAAASTVKPIAQIAHRISAEWNGTDQSIRLTLTPAQLGTVRITFSRVDDEVVGMLEIQKAETRRQIEEALPQLVSTIQETGVPLRKVELLQWDANPQSQKDDPSSQYDLSQQREFSHPDTPDSSMSGRGQTRGQSDPVSRTSQSTILNTDDFDDVEADEGLNLFI